MNRQSTASFGTVQREGPDNHYRSLGGRLVEAFNIGSPVLFAHEKMKNGPVVPDTPCPVRIPVCDVVDDDFGHESLFRQAPP